jgi:hypothetical protein
VLGVGAAAVVTAEVLENVEPLSPQALTTAATVSASATASATLPC